MARTRPRTASFLIRFWEESREGSGGKPVVRGYLRNLSSGEGIYLGDPKQIPNHIERCLGSEWQEAANADEAPEAEEEKKSG